MISIGGIIGAGLFVGSSVTINAAGPAVVLSYLIAGILVLLVMRMLGEMAVALPQVRTFTDFARTGLGDWAGFVVGWLYWYFWIVVVPVEAIAGAQLLQLVDRAAGLADRRRPDGDHDRRQPDVGALLRRVRVLVRLIKVTAIVVFIVVAAAWAFGLTSGAAPTWQQPRQRRRLRAARRRWRCWRR